ncbi:conserved exported hypothetical protein [Cupriavidus taiwanensis]|uniref:Cap15 family cyclic dinucleotide receptor domain-containing protein n=1 Tax=Cupriavidus taiwanensis TaxID=164546 RepID=UPI000E186EB8|nr:hypothetical protein [Cupriavidus taiwanensis]SPA26716.1 conserved exported hypothetical protein [Cupriavidus taiwanensis]
MVSINHEYSVIGHSRATIGRWLGVVAGLLSSLIASLAAGAFALADALGFTLRGPDPIVIPATAAIFYFLGHLAFDKWAWRKSLVHKIIGVPDLNGKWDCQGTTLDADTRQVKYQWTASVTISQSWEKIKVHLNTGQSRSNSVAASIVKQEGVGFILMYSYRNEPKPGEAELNAHIGYCELHISEDMKSADGMYFNSGGRFTHGKMNLKRGLK